MKTKVLFLCTHNSARSQMAEAWLRHLYGAQYESFSAGTQSNRVNPYVIRVMEEVGIDMSSHVSKNVTEFFGDVLDIIVTVCDNAKEACPYFPGGKKYMHQSFPDPSALSGTDEEILAGVRIVREQIKEWILITFI